MPAKLCRCGHDQDEHFRHGACKKCGCEGFRALRRIQGQYVLECVCGFLAFGTTQPEVRRALGLHKLDDCSEKAVVFATEI